VTQDADNVDTPSSDSASPDLSPARTKNEPATPLGYLWKMKLWKKGCLTLSVVLMVLGVCLPFVLPTAAAPAVTDTASTGDLDFALQPNGLAPVENDLPNGDATGVSAKPKSTLSPTLFRFGFSFFVGFAIAFALRSFMKVSLVVMGLWFLMLFGLEYAGLIEVNWGAVSQHYDSFAGWLRSEASSMHTFITGRLPAAGAAAAGLVAGFTRK